MLHSFVAPGSPASVRGCPDGFVATGSTSTTIRPTPPHQTHRARPQPGGFALHEAPQRRVTGVSNPHVVQFPPASHVQVDETSRDRTTRPTPRATGRENFAPMRPRLIAPHEDISAIKQNQKNQTATN